MREVEVLGVRVERPSNQPLVLLREAPTGDSQLQCRYLPIWIGAVEASAIAVAQSGETADRPPTHQLVGDIVEVLGDELVAVHIVDVRDGVFFASLRFASGAHVDARPSDSIALALRAKVSILCADEVLDLAGIREEDVQSEQRDVAEMQVALFRDFLDQVDPDDFAR